MSPTSARFCAGALLLHLCLVTGFALRDLTADLPSSAGLLPKSSNGFWRRSQAAISSALGEDLSPSNPVRQGIAAYAHGAGIESGYSYFAPEVPNSYKLAFRFSYPDGRTEFDLPSVSGDAAGYRLATLLDILQQFHYAPLRDALVQALVLPVWQRHPDAIRVEAVIAVATLPSIAQYQSGERKSYRVLETSEFRPRHDAQGKR